MTNEEAMEILQDQKEIFDEECALIKAINVAIKALEAVGNSDKLEPKQKKPHWNPHYDMWECNCGRFIDDEFGYCPWCGCELDWSEE